MSLGKIPLKDKTIEAKSVEKLFPSDMSLGKILPPWHQFLDQKIRGAHFSLGIVAGERFAIELTPSTFPQRHFAGDMFPQRHVAGEKVGMLLGKASNVVVLFPTVNTKATFVGNLTKRDTGTEIREKRSWLEQIGGYLHLRCTRHQGNDDEPSDTKQCRVLTEIIIFMMFAFICFVPITYRREAGILMGLPQSDCCCSQDIGYNKEVTVLLEPSDEANALKLIGSKLLTNWRFQEEIGDQNLLLGGIVGGSDAHSFADHIDNSEQFDPPYLIAMPRFLAFNHEESDCKY
ncbi:hypothetical protein Tco_1041437 [Tanacetum coccineum]|uniref:Uncharacterized protein n=2 Tax=Tanacetum coccineum TaxID=301880 RepID=A0ABQ5GIG5_9ASTR